VRPKSVRRGVQCVELMVRVRPSGVTTNFRVCAWKKKKNVLFFKIKNTTPHIIGIYNKMVHRIFTDRPVTNRPDDSPLYAMAIFLKLNTAHYLVNSVKYYSFRKYIVLLNLNSLLNIIFKKWVVRDTYRFWLVKKTELTYPSLGKPHGVTNMTSFELSRILLKTFCLAFKLFKRSS